jgi:putative PEP-CTERM system histidine kinase
MESIGSVNPSTILALATAGSAALGLFALLRRPGLRWTWPFALGMFGFAAEAGAAYVLLTLDHNPASRLLWLRVWLIAGLGLLIPWGIFVTRLGDPQGAPLSRVRRLALVGAGLAVTAAVAAVLALPAFVPTDVAEGFYAAQLEVAARWSVIVQMVLSVGLLAGLEVCLRNAPRVSRWRVKYLILGLGGIFLARFFFLSQMLLFQVVLASYLITGGALQTAGSVVVALFLLRDRRLAADLQLSPQVFYRSILVGVLGLYLLAVGGLGWLLNYFRIPAEAFWGSVVIFVTAIALAAVLLSEHVRWRVRRFVSRHFYTSKYDYRTLWERFTRRLGSRLAIEELAQEVLAVATDAAGAQRAALYVADDQGLIYHLVGALEADGAPPTIPADAPILTRFGRGSRTIALENGEATPFHAPATEGLARLFGPGSAAATLSWQGRITGIMVIGPERTGTPYGPDDFEFFAAVVEQAAGAIMTARLSESVARAREFEAFHHLTAFVIHDLKNSISALSLLSQNALANFDDPEFQRDAIRTLSRTVDRMKGLLARLAPARDSMAFRFQPVDLAALALEATRPLDGSGRVSLVKELAPVTPVPGDADALLRVIQNLVTNAVESIQERGTVTVRTYEADGWAVCSVEDTGRGMSPDFVRRSLFAPFRSTKRGGWGVGLYQAKGIVEGHRGVIDVSSEEGRGSVFTMKLPLSRPGRGARARQGVSQ